MNKHPILKTLFFILLFASCQKNRLDVDVSKVQVPDVKIERLEQDMFKMNPDSIAQQSAYMMKKYGGFYADLVTGFINDGGIHDSSYAYNLKRFITDRDMHGAYLNCEKEYPSMKWLEKPLQGAFKHFKYYFPDKPIPHVVTLMSGFNYSIIYTDTTLGIGLEMYLGPDNMYYKMLTYPKYKKQLMQKAYILTDCIKGWMTTLFPKDGSKNDFLSIIVHNGKILYLEDALLPHVNDTLKIGYTEKQLEWVKDNQFNMWAYFIQNKLLYSTNYGEIIKYTNEGPFTPTFNRKYCPARVGNWIGWQIVRAYMNKHPEVTLRQLMKEENAQKILYQSKYKPEK